MRKRLMFGIIVALGFAAAWALCAQESEEHHFSIQRQPTLFIINPNGRTIVTGRQGNEVSVTANKVTRASLSPTEARIAAASVVIRVERKGQRIEIAAKQPKEPLGTEVVLTIFAPMTSDLNIEAGEGAVAVKNLAGKVHIKSAGAQIEADDCQGALRAASAEGDIRIDGFNGSLQVASTEGNITVNGVLNRLDASSQTGRLSLTALPKSEMAATWSVQTRSGDIRMTIPRSFSAELELISLDGEIDADRLLPLLTIDPSSTPGRLIGKTGRAGKKLRIHTGLGNIEFRGQAP